MSDIKAVPATAAPSFEFIAVPELARRLNLPETWVYEQTRARCKDPIPQVRFGRYPRFEWGSPALNEWIDKRRRHQP